MSDLNEAILAQRKLPVLSFDDVSSLQLEVGQYIYHFPNEPLPLYLFAHIKDKKLPLTIFGQGYLDRSEVELPRFQRMNWSEKIKENVVVINDPTLFIADLPLGWCIGTPEYYPLPRIVEAIRLMAEQLEIGPKNLLFYGSSAGGFTSLMMASYFSGASVLINNPQTDVLKFKRGGTNALLKSAFNGIGLSEAHEQFGARFSVIERLKQPDASLPRIYYWQNLCDEDHCRDQMNPFMSFLARYAQQSDKSDHSQSILFDCYRCPKSQHNPLGPISTTARLRFLKPWQYEGLEATDSMSILS
ncbi:hypothetical protein RI570_00095 [Brucella pseudogrignonensis]|uniref:hypothetical protein n=1 Tax=Brucella pseudogrignonensis TaxID=419475 RepID=UPI0028B9CD4F|nr:hypothetical protein [Brucella pseudogrignonensis]MDT6938561.1 hypothetical protein [Brucella pseudogrignonensis]